MPEFCNTSEWQLDVVHGFSQQEVSLSLTSNDDELTVLLIVLDLDDL